MPAVDAIWGGATSVSYNTTTNWLDNLVPVATDRVRLTSGAANSLETNLNQSAVAIASFIQDMGFTKGVGTLVAGVRTSLQLNCALITLGLAPVTGSPGGSGRIYLDMAAIATVISVMNSNNTPSDTGQTPIHLLGTSMTLNVNGGVVGVALNAGEVSTLTALSVDGGAIALGASVTPTAMTAYSGTIISASTITAPTVTLYSTANYVFNGAATHTAIQSYKGSTIKFNGTGTITAMNLGGLLDLSGGMGIVTITNMNRSPGGRINDPNKRLVLTNPWVDVGGAVWGDSRSDFGPNRSYRVSG